MESLGKGAALMAAAGEREGSHESSTPVGEPSAALPDGEEFVEAVETVSRGIHDPVAKLRYLRGSLARHPGADRGVQALPWAPVRRGLYRWLSLEDLRRSLTTSPLGVPVPLDAALRRSLVLGRGAMLAAAVAAVGLAGVVYSTLPRGAALGATSLPMKPAAPAPGLPRALTPAAVWLVEEGKGWQLYSNGLRIDTTFAVRGEPRRYLVFVEGGEPQEAREPAGILFHTSESDIWPLQASYNENLRDSTQRLLRYVRRLRLYNFLIDRFGRVYRVVEEETRANHAGHSVWARGALVYVNLNPSFVGICFETRWEGGRALPITQAQLASGLNLSDYLRQRFNIPPEMCVTHGLTSVNPEKRLIGHHLDWARGFPFQAFGLPDQYGRVAPSVAVFGFGYDEDFLKILGEPWAGVRKAERALAREAWRLGKSVDDVRRERQGLYHRWSELQSGDEERLSVGKDALERSPSASKAGASF